MKTWPTDFGDIYRESSYKYAPTICVNLSFQKEMNFGRPRQNTNAFALHIAKVIWPGVMPTTNDEAPGDNTP
ncbi:hypothetical protein 162275548 [Organic Lake phycodnavirus]|nr:hypothetical protein 162275548 [Organic Lake phycodnavirus]